MTSPVTEFEIKTDGGGKRYVHFRGPGCKTTIDASLQRAGVTMKCPTCGQELRIPTGPDRPHRPPKARAAASTTPRPAILPPAPGQREAPGGSKVDALLFRVFKVAKSASVGFLVLCLLVIGAAVVGWMRSAPPESTGVAPEAFVPPAVGDYRLWSSGADPSANAITAPDAPGKSHSLVSVFAEAGLSSEAASGFAESIDLADSDTHERSELLHNVRAFLQECRTSSPPVRTTAQTLDWYAVHYNLGRSYAKKPAELDREVLAAARTTAQERRSLFVAIGTAAVVVMLASQILPLLIEIEQNTRRRP